MLREGFLGRVTFKTVRKSRRQHTEKDKVKRVPGRTLFLKSYCSDINIIQPVFLCLVFIFMPYLFLSLYYQVPVSL